MANQSDAARRYSLAAESFMDRVWLFAEDNEYSGSDTVKLLRALSRCAREHAIHKSEELKQQNPRRTRGKGGRR